MASEPLSSVALPAVIAAAVSAFVNYLMNLRVLRKKDEMRMVEDKLRMNAFILYYLNEMKFTYDVISSHLDKEKEEDGYLYLSDKNKNEMKSLIEAIDNKLREQPHLVTPNIHKKWIEVKSLYFDEKSKKATSELRKMLADEGNQIIKKYLKYIKQDIISGFLLDEPGASTKEHSDRNDKATSGHN
jgi:hypothetical protein